jgi:hypothetical protein
MVPYIHVHHSNNGFNVAFKENLDSASDSGFKRSLEQFFSASLKYLEFWILRGKRKKAMMARRTVSPPSIRKRYCHPYRLVSLYTTGTKAQS